MKKEKGIKGFLSQEIYSDTNEINSLDIYKIPLQIIDYYLEKYFKEFNIYHPKINDNNFDNIIQFFLEGYCEGHYGTFLLGEISYKEWKKIIDKHFKTQYNNCDYNIYHFCSPFIVMNRYYETVY